MKTTKVYEILKNSELERKGQILFESENFEFYVHHKDVANVDMIIIIKKQFRGAWSPIIITNLKELREKLPIKVK